MYVEYRGKLGELGQFEIATLLPSLIQGTINVAGAFLKSKAQTDAIKAQSKAQLISIISKYKGIREQRELEMEQRAMEAQTQQAGFPGSQLLGGIPTWALILVAGVGIVMIIRR